MTVTAFPLDDAIDRLGLSVLVLDQTQSLAFVSGACRTLLTLGPDICPLGASFETAIRKIAASGAFGATAPESQIPQRLDPVRGRRPVQLEWRHIDGRTIVETGTPLANGGYAFSFSPSVESDSDKIAEKLRSASKATILTLADLAEFRDTLTGDHVIRVARLAHEITRTLVMMGAFGDDLTPDVCRHIALASILHDVGKVAISDTLLHKPGPLTADERKAMEKHCRLGAEILRKSLALSPDQTCLDLAATIALHHHERFDGQGYPDGLKGEAIPVPARIVAAADVFDALLSARPYKQPWSEDAAMTYVANEAGRQFDPRVVAAMLQVSAERKQTPVFAWTAAMSVGNAELDRDHRVLIGLVNQLALKSNRDDRIVQEFVLDELVGYAAGHFSREEDYLQKIGFADIDRHKAIHRGFARELDKIRSHFAQADGDIGEEVWDFAAQWLRHHILEEDQVYTQAARG